MGLTQELAKGGKVQKLEEQQKDLARECTKLEAQLEIMAANLKEEDTNINTLETNQTEVSRLTYLCPLR